MNPSRRQSGLQKKIEHLLSRGQLPVAERLIRKALEREPRNYWLRTKLDSIPEPEPKYPRPKSSETGPSIPKIRKMLEGWKGKLIWDPRWSMLGISIELGTAWRAPRTDGLRGKESLFVECGWEIVSKQGVVLHSRMRSTKTRWRKLKSLLDAKRVRRITFNAASHKLQIVTEDGHALLIKPGLKRVHESWTLFYRASPEEWNCCTLNGVSVRYND